MSRLYLILTIYSNIGIMGYMYAKHDPYFRGFINFSAKDYEIYSKYTKLYKGIEYYCSYPIKKRDAKQTHLVTKGERIKLCF